MVWTPLTMNAISKSALLMTAVLEACTRASRDAPARRFAIIVGNDSGGEGTRDLSYARDDARKLYGILTRLGGVRTDDAFLLLNDSAESLLKALAEVEKRSSVAREAGDRTALFFYYSGHAKDGALRLGNSALPLDSLKSRLSQAPADFRLAVFDACRSGSLTRTKGVRLAPAFDVQTEAQRPAKGLVILTSSSSDEDSQESDSIGGSYFSHHLASGLLGDADTSGDGRVSLAEAYAYAYERTVADTADSAAGPQHPTFSFDLAGNGDLVLTDVVVRKEGVRLPAAAPSGEWFLVDRRGFVVAEIAKTDGVERLVALAPGKYWVKRRLVDHLRVGEISVSAGEISLLDDRDLRNADFSDDPVKGAYQTLTYTRHWSLAIDGAYSLMFDKPLNQGGYFPSSPQIGVDVTFHNAFGRGWSVAFDGSYGWSSGTLLHRQRRPGRLLVLGVGGRRDRHLGVARRLVRAVRRRSRRAQPLVAPVPRRRVAVAVVLHVRARARRRREVSPEQELERARPRSPQLPSLHRRQHTQPRQRRVCGPHQLRVRSMRKSVIGIAADHRRCLRHLVQREDLEFLYARPDRDTLHANVPGEATSTNTTQQPLSVGDPSPTYATTKDQTDQFNAFLDEILDGLDAIRQVPPTTRLADGRIWGPYDDSSHPGFQVQVEIDRNADAGFDWKLSYRPDGQAFFDIGNGNFQPTVSLKEGIGSFQLNGLLSREELDAGKPGDPNLVTVDYQTDAARAKGRADALRLGRRHRWRPRQHRCRVPLPRRRRRRRHCELRLHRQRPERHDAQLHGARGTSPGEGRADAVGASSRLRGQLPDAGNPTWIRSAGTPRSRSSTAFRTGPAEPTRACPVHA